MAGTPFTQLAPGAAVTLSSATFLASGLWTSQEAFLAGLADPVPTRRGPVGRRPVHPLARGRDASVRKAARHRGSRQAVPLHEVVRSHPRDLVLGGGALCAAFGAGYVASVFLPGYGARELGPSRTTMLALGVVGGLVVAVIGAASAVDRYGRRPILMAGGIATIGGGLVVFPLVDTGDVRLVAVGLCLLQACGGVCLGPAAAMLPELFPTGYRYTGAGLAYNLGAASRWCWPLSCSNRGRRACRCADSRQQRGECRRRRPPARRAFVQAGAALASRHSVGVRALSQSDSHSTRSTRAKPPARQAERTAWSGCCPAPLPREVAGVVRCPT